MINRDVLSLISLKSSFIVSESADNDNLEVGVTINERGHTENFATALKTLGQKYYSCMKRVS